MKRTLKLSIVITTVATLILFGISATAFAKPVTADGFVCPVLGGKAGVNGKATVIVTPPGGFNTVIGPNVTVPVYATNMNGGGSPGGPFASPGEENYSPIWPTR